MRTFLWSVLGLFMLGVMFVGLTDDTTTRTDTDGYVLWGFAAVGVFSVWRAMVSWDRGHQERLALEEMGTQRRIAAAVEKALAEERAKNQ